MRVFIFTLIALFITAGAGIDNSRNNTPTPNFNKFKINKIDLDRVSYYHNIVTKTDDTPNITANGYSITDSSKIIAVSRDLLAHLPYGTVVYLSIGGNLEKYTVQDTMNKRYRNSIDVFVPKGGKIYPDNNLFVLK